MTSRKYRVFHMSRYQFPTRVVMRSGSKGDLVIGHVSAQKVLEEKLGRSLHDKTKVDKRGGNWCFREPK